MLVVAAHCNFIFLPITGPVDAWLMLGQYGVELFFALSGFLIGGILCEHAESAQPGWAPRFWLRRWLRTLPDFYLFLLINVLIPQPAGFPAPSLKYAFFVQNLVTPQPLFFIESWSLAVEEWFYLLAPILIFVVGMLKWRRIGALAWVWMAIAAVTAVRLGYVAEQHPRWDDVRMMSSVRLDAIAYGVVAVLMVRRGLSLRTAQVLAAAGTLGLSVSIVGYLTIRESSPLAKVLLFDLIPASCAALLPLAARWREAGPGFVTRSVVRVAVWSYALYLAHLTTLRILQWVLGWKPVTLSACLAQLVVELLAAFLLAAAVTRFYETPILRWRDKALPGRRIVTHAS